MTRLGIVRNPRSRRNRARGPLGAVALPGGALLAEPETKAKLGETLEGFAAHGVDLLAVDGGDGTVRDVLSAARERFERLPALALLASGKTNILAGDVGHWGTGEAALRRLAGAAADGGLDASARRAALTVSSDGRQRLGFVFGLGAYAKAVALADRGVADRLGEGARVAASVGRVAAILLRSAERREWLAGTLLRLSIDGSGDGAMRPRLIALATTLNRFTLGIWPFWGDAGGPLRYLDVDAPPPRLGAALLPALRGAPRPWMGPSYRSGSASSLRFDTAAPFVLDGETYAPGADGRVRVETGPTVGFVVP